MTWGFETLLESAANVPIASGVYAITCRNNGKKYVGSAASGLRGRRPSFKGFRLPGVAPIKYPEYDLISPTGEQHHVTCLHHFCQAHGIRTGNMWTVLHKGRGVCQGWRAAT